MFLVVWLDRVDWFNGLWLGLGLLPCKKETTLGKVSVGYVFLLELVILRGSRFRKVSHLQITDVCGIVSCWCCNWVIKGEALTFKMVRPTPAGPVRWQYWPPHSDFLFFIRDPHVLQKIWWSQFLRPAIDSNTANSALILSENELANSCHTIEN
jgi:hypothetical protein